MQWKLILVFAFINICTTVFAQRADSAFIGAWQKQSYSVGDFNYNDQPYEVMSFYPDSAYQIIRTNANQDTFIEAGKWQYYRRSKSVALTQRHNIPPSQGTQPDHLLCIEKVSDSNLIICGNEGNLPYRGRYAKIPNINKVPDTAFKSSQKAFNLFLVNTNSNKKIKLSKYEYITVVARPFYIDSATVIYNEYTGYISLNYLVDTFLQIMPYSERSRQVYQNGQRTLRHYTVYEEPEGLKPLSLNYINYIEYSTPARRTSLDISSFVLFSSITSALLMAPLVSINYKNGDFNSTRYYNWAISGLAGTAISLPFVIKFSPRKYFITTSESGTKGKNLWRLVKD